MARGAHEPHQASIAFLVTGLTADTPLLAVCASDEALMMLGYLDAWEHRKDAGVDKFFVGLSSSNLLQSLGLEQNRMRGVEMISARWL